MGLRKCEYSFGASALTATASVVCCPRVLSKTEAVEPTAVTSDGFSGAKLRFFFDAAKFRLPDFQIFREKHAEKRCRAFRNVADAMRQRHALGNGAESVVEAQFVFGRVAEVDFTLDILLGGDERGFGEFLVVARDLDLLAVLGNLFEVVVERGEFLEFLVEVVFHLACDLV